MKPDETFFIDDRDRYARLRLIPWWDQARLSRARILVVGAGALGNEVLKNFALLGVGHLVVVDDDLIEVSNLTRSPLYRESDAGRPKAETAAERVREINPDVQATGIRGNILHDVGLGLFADVDLVLGCVDNREARLWINRQCWKVGTPWVDGAIQELMGTVKIFTPPRGACYECAMTENDYRLLNLRYACPLLRREDLQEGRTPTTPTAAAITAGLQSQEALKILHGIQEKAGHAIVFEGVSNRLHVTRLPWNDGCMSHVRYQDIREIPIGRKATAREVLQAVAGATELHLERDLVISVRCERCRTSADILRPRSAVSVRQAKCTSCGQLMAADLTLRIGADSRLVDRRLADLGVPPDDVVRVRCPDGYLCVRLAADRRPLPVLGDRSS